ncbi:MAG: 50S ribosomal protein L5 [Parcubacteria group bacterium]
MSKIKEQYNKEVVPEMKKIFGLKNNLEVPRIKKVVVNVGIGKYLKDGNLVKEVTESVTQITGQKPLATKSRKSIAGFKIREGLEVGLKVTLRGKRMWDFLERLIGAAIPRIRDFQGIKKSAVDDGGNLNIGIKEHMVFPEINPESVKSTMSLQVNVVTDAKNKKEALELFRLMKFPIIK